MEIEVQTYACEDEEERRVVTTAGVRRGFLQLFRCFLRLRLRPCFHFLLLQWSCPVTTLFTFSPNAFFRGQFLAESPSKAGGFNVEMRRAQLVPRGLRSFERSKCPNEKWVNRLKTWKPEAIMGQNFTRILKMNPKVSYRVHAGLANAENTLLSWKTGLCVAEL